MSRKYYWWILIAVIPLFTACGGSSGDDDNGIGTGSGNISALKGEYRGTYFSFGLSDEVANGNLNSYQLHSGSSLNLNSADEEKGKAAAVLNQDASKVSSVLLEWNEGLNILTDNYDYPSLYSNEPYEFEWEGQHLTASFDESVVDDQEELQGVALGGTDTFFHFSGNIISAGQWQADYFEKREGVVGEKHSQFNEASLSLYSKKPQSLTQSELAGAWGGVGYSSFYNTNSNTYLMDEIFIEHIQLDGAGVADYQVSGCPMVKGVGKTEDCSNWQTVKKTYEVKVGSASGTATWHHPEEENSGIAYVNAYKNMMVSAFEEALYINVKLSETIAFSELTNLSFELHGIGRTKALNHHGQESLVATVAFVDDDGAKKLDMKNIKFSRTTLAWDEGEDTSMVSQEITPLDRQFTVTAFESNGYFEAVAGIYKEDELKDIEVRGFIASDGDNDGSPDGVVLIYKELDYHPDTEVLRAITSGIGVVGLVD